MLRHQFLQESTEGEPQKYLFSNLARVCAVAMAMELVKNKAYKMVFVYLKNPVIRLFSSFAHYELTLNPFCQHCSNKILT